VPALLTRPQVALPQHRTSLDEVCALVREVHAAVPGVERFVAVMRATQVEQRYFIRPAAEVLATSDLEHDLRVTVACLGELAEQAARAALDAAGLTAADVDCLITTSVTGYVMPGLDVTLAGALGLRPQVRRIPAAQIGCAGTGWALARAREQVELYPGSRVLVVAAEAFSSCLQPADVTLDAMIFKALGGDGAAACVVADSRACAGPGLVLHESWDYLLPASADFYGLTIAADGLHFYSTRAATRATGAVMKPLRSWLDQTRDSAPLGWAAVHTGGPLILTAAAEGLGLEDKDLRYSWDSLRAIGNVGSTGLQDVLARLFDEPPADGPGVIIAFGPGFAATATTAVWNDR
jgi:predicted naringenin-chalcone synthase